MISVTSAQLDAWLAGFFFPLVRILAVMASAPVFNNVGTPIRTRLAIGLALGLAVIPTVSVPAGIEPGSWRGLAVLGQEVLIGLALGFALRVVFAAVDVAGELIGLQMGLGFAVFYDPGSSGQTAVVAEFLGLLATLVFLALNGHLMVVSVLSESFAWLPVGSLAATGNWGALARWGTTIFAAGVLLALPLIATLLVTNIALGVLTRAAPQLNLFAVGFPVTLIVGFGMLVLAMPLFAPALERLFEQGLEAMSMVLRAPAGG